MLEIELIQLSREELVGLAKSEPVGSTARGDFRGHGRGNGCALDLCCFLVQSK